jgi:hypothetical protein
MTHPLKGTMWPRSELDLLARLYPGEGGSAAVRQLLPHRTTNAIRQQARRLGLLSGAKQGQPEGSYLGAVRCVQTLRERCVMDDETGCWHLRSPSGRPMPTDGYVHQLYLHGTGKISATRAAMILAGKPAGKGQMVWRGCKSYDCVRPEHLRVGTRAQWGKHLQATGVFRTPEAQASRTRQKAHLRKLSAEQVQIVRSSELSAIKLAAELGVSKTTVNAIRAGTLYRDLVRGASVFSWRPA